MWQVQVVAYMVPWDMKMNKVQFNFSMHLHSKQETGHDLCDSNVSQSDVKIFFLSIDIRDLFWLVI